MASSSFQSARSILCLSISAAILVLLTTPAFAQFRNVYSDTADAHSEIRDALARAAREHKRVLLDFGGNWCGDCQVLDIYFHREPNADLLSKNYILVDVNVGKYDKNLDLAKQYDIPLQKGVPALAILDAHGHLLYSQRQGEFEAMRRMDPNSVTQFLEHWKPNRQ